MEYLEILTYIVVLALSAYGTSVGIGTECKAGIVGRAGMGFLVGVFLSAVLLAPIYLVNWLFF